MRHPYMAIQDRAQRKINGASVPLPVAPVETDDAPGTARKTPVFWTTEEKMIVARAMRELRAKDLSLTNLEAARLAQSEALPVDRQRVLAQERQIAELVALIREIALQESLAARPALETVRAGQQQMLEATLANTAPPSWRQAFPEKPAPEGKRKAHVRWTSDDKRLIALESKRLRSTNIGMTRLDAIRQAIEYALPPERRRNINKFEKVADWIEDEWKALDEAERATQAEREARERAAELERQAEESRRATEAARAEAEAAKALDPASLPFATLIEAIGVKIAGMLLRSVGEQLQDSIMQRITEALGNVTLPSPLPEGATRLHAAPRNRKPRVLVVGLVRQQEEDIKRALGELLTLEYARVEHADNLEDKARGADLVVLMTKFISHKHQDIVRRVNEHIVYRNGGVTELKRWLTQWINGEVIPATA